MKVGVDASRISVAKRTGTENYSYNLIRELVKHDTDQFVLYLRGELPEFARGRENVLMRRIGLPRLWTQLGLAYEVAIRQPDVLFVPAHTMPVIHRRSLKTVVTIHDLGAEFLSQYHKFPHSLYLNRTTEYVAKYATHLIAVSEATKRDLITRLGVSEDRITVVYESWDRGIFHKPAVGEVIGVRKKYKLDRDYLLFVGTIQPRKNLERLIEAFSKARVSEDLILAGKPGWMDEPIYMAAKKSGVGGRVKFLNHVPDIDLPALYGGSTALVFPSLHEGFGIPVLEAMACETVVLTSSTTSLPEVGGDAALYVDPEDAQSIAEGIEEIVSNTKLRDLLLSKGKLQVQKFSWEKAANETLGVLRRVYEKV
jgi:glycosyltransferase involved in cell wall biosynthesis